ncbi:MAG: FAD-dependent oxidoreductase [Gemmatimonadaceae bacterium]
MSVDQVSLSGPDLTKGVPSTDVSEGALLLGHADGEAVLLTRTVGEIVAVGATCTHYGAPLCEGLIVGDTLRCPWHHAAFSLRTGKSLRPPAFRDLPRWNAEERDGSAYVTGRMSEVTNDVPSRTDAGPASASPESIVIVGGGAAGSMAAETLRREGYDGPVTIIEAGPSAPYDRPNLSKDYLAGTAPEDWIPLRDDSFYVEKRIDFLLNSRVTAIDMDLRRVTLEGGDTLPFGALLIATGAQPIQLDVPDPDNRIHYLRTLADSRAIIDAALRAKSAVIIGASFIGLEVAASLRARGLAVTVVGPEARPLERVLGEQLGDFVRGLHEEHGVSFRLGQTASAIGRDSVTLSGGETLPADLVVVGIGVRAYTGLAEASGIATDRGIVVDQYLETSVPGIFAAGDLARWPDAQSGENIRVEHWVVAQRQGQTAARNMLAGRNGGRRRFDAVPFFWSQHYDVSISYTGHADRWDAIEVQGDIGAHDCTVTYRYGGRVMAVATIFRDLASLKAELAMERRLET